jgi:hypothetical protein
MFSHIHLTTTAILTAASFLHVAGAAPAPTLAVATTKIIPNLIKRQTPGHTHVTIGSSTIKSVKHIAPEDSTEINFMTSSSDGEDSKPTSILAPFQIANFTASSSPSGEGEKRFAATLTLPSGDVVICQASSGGSSGEEKLDGDDMFPCGGDEANVFFGYPRPGHVAVLGPVVISG